MIFHDKAVSLISNIFSTRIETFLHIRLQIVDVKWTVGKTTKKLIQIFNNYQLVS